MAGTETATDLEIFQELKEMFAEEAPCEGIGHGKHPAHPYPEEAGEWYLFTHCPDCEVEKTLLVCNTMKEVCSGYHLMECINCMNISYASEIIVRSVRKGEVE